jgi:hypothetical protein
MPIRHERNDARRRVVITSRVRSQAAVGFVTPTSEFVEAPDVDGFGRYDGREGFVMLKTGDVVHLKSKPEQSLTVADVTDGYPGASPLCECHWWVSGELHKRHFPEHKLEQNGQRS